MSAGREIMYGLWINHTPLQFSLKDGTTTKIGKYVTLKAVPYNHIPTTSSKMTERVRYAMSGQRGHREPNITISHTRTPVCAHSSYQVSHLLSTISLNVAIDCEVKKINKQARQDKKTLHHSIAWKLFNAHQSLCV